MASFTGNGGDTRISIEEIVIDLWDRLESILGKKFARKSMLHDRFPFGFSSKKICAQNWLEQVKL